MDLQQLLTLKEESKLFPFFKGGRIHLTLWRLCRKGYKGVKLEYGRLGSRIVTSRPALKRLMKRLADLEDEVVSPTRPHNLPRRTVRPESIASAEACRR